MDGGVVLIGMPGAGKSTLGVLAAKALSLDFVDTDVLIQSREGRNLQQLIGELGPEGFLDLEAAHVRSLDTRRAVIATGGSVVHRPEAMDHLCTLGAVVHLALPLESLERRLENLAVRGVVLREGQDLRELYRERMPLYARYADLTVHCDGLGHEQALAAMLEGLSAAQR
jgi:shikimate kinase